VVGEGGWSGDGAVCCVGFVVNLPTYQAEKWITGWKERGSWDDVHDHQWSIVNGLDCC
jgi:hypothetical protein